MAQKRKTKQFRLADAEDLLKTIEKETRRDVKGHLTDNWRDNLFEILMTRMEIAAKHKKNYAKITSELKKSPEEAPKFAKNFFKTMHKILFMARAPDTPLHIAALSVLYVSVVDTFLKDNTKDLSKTMTALDKRLGYFENLVNLVPCSGCKKN